jgi:hypothetical protein
MSKQKIYYYAYALLLTLFALEPLHQLYMECKLGYFGLEMPAAIVNIPHQPHRNGVKKMYVGIEGRPVLVLISGPDYAQKRFFEGQTVSVKYLAADRQATLSSEFNWRIIYYLVMFGGPAVFFWVAGYREVSETRSKWRRGGII